MTKTKPSEKIAETVTEWAYKVVFTDSSFNQTVARFNHKGRIYEIDYLLDADNNGFKKYDIFDVTNGGLGDCVGHVSSRLSEDNVDELIELAKKAIDNHDKN